MPYKIAGIDVHKKVLAVVVSDVEIESEYQFERRMFNSNPEQLRSLAAWLVEQEAEEVVMYSLHFDSENTTIPLGRFRRYSGVDDLSANDSEEFAYLLGAQHRHHIQLCKPPCPHPNTHRSTSHKNKNQNGRRCQIHKTRPVYQLLQEPPRKLGCYDP